MDNITSDYFNEDEVISENTLFHAFEVTLEALKQLRISKGEIIDETPVFVKRSLQLT